MSLDDARAVMEVAGSERKVWDQVQLARYLWWTLLWRGLDAKTDPFAHECFVLCQEMMAQGTMGKVNYDMGERIAGSLVAHGYQSAMDGLDDLEDF